MQTKTLVLCATFALCSGPLAGTAQSVSDPQAFAASAASSNMFEIQSSQLALEQQPSTDVRAFAQQMIQDHTLAGKKMLAAAQKDGITPPTGLAPKEQAELDQLQATPADSFEAAYVSEQTKAHDEAVALFESFSQNGKESALRAFAVDTLPTLKQHQTEVHRFVEAN